MAGEPAMRSVRYAQGEQARYGVLEGETVRSVTGDPFNGGLTAGDTVGTLGEITLLPPVHPGKIVAIGLSYQSHITAAAPITFLKPQTSLIGSDAAIHLPAEMK